MSADFDKKFKPVINFVEDSDINSPNKPVIPHLKRVGCYLFNKGFSDEVVTAGLLHDMLEWSTVSGETIRKKYGKNILDIVKANTKNRNIVDERKRREDIFVRCKKLGEEAYAVRAADVIDNFFYYSSILNKKELARCYEYTDLLLFYIPKKLKVIFFEDLKKIMGK